MSVDDALAAVKRRRLYVTNLYEGTDHVWRCFLRSTLHGRHIHGGIGKTAEGAIRDALPDDFAELLG